MESVRKYFNIWRTNVSYIRYDRWCEENFEELLREQQDEIKYAAENDMDPVYWCWHCKYGDCEDH